MNMVTDDSHTRKNEEKYVPALGSTEALDIFNIRPAKEPVISEKGGL